MSEPYVFLQIKKYFFWTRNFAIVISLIYRESERKLQIVSNQGLEYGLDDEPGEQEISCPVIRGQEVDEGGVSSPWIPLRFMSEKSVDEDVSTVTGRTSILKTMGSST